MLKVIENARTIGACQQALKRAVTSLADEAREHRVGYPGGGTDTKIYYLKAFKFWMAFGKASGRYFNPAGIGYPFDVATPAPSLEMNFPLSGINRRVAGVFLEDDDGERYVGHSGKIGGGAKGVSLTNFVKFYPGTSTVRSGDKVMDAYVRGRLGDPGLVASIVEFTRVSAEFRASVKAAKKPPTKGDRKSPPSDAFSPEFVGEKVYTTAEIVAAECRHGTVVKALREQLIAAGYQAANTVQRDLYVTGATGMRALFEVKMMCDTTNVYGSVGQLFFHGGGGAAKHLVAVLPDGVNANVRMRLAALGLRLVTFKWADDGAPVFDGLAAILRALAKRARG